MRDSGKKDEPGSFAVLNEGEKHLAHLPFMKFYPADWIQDTRSLTKEARAVWIDLICQMWTAPERGHLEWTQKQFEAFVGAETDPQTATEIWNELLHSGIGELEIIDGIMHIKCRRIIKEENERNQAHNRVKRFRNGDVTQKKRRIYQKSEVRSHISDPTVPPKSPQIGTALVREDFAFNRFWNLYPRKEAKTLAYRAWQKEAAHCSDVQDAIFAALEWQIDQPQWHRNNGQFIPLPASYLNQRRWTDHKPEVKRSFLRESDEQNIREFLKEG